MALGLLGLLGIAVLILIYLLKPNYQQKVISSTYVWKLSLKYKKKKIPISKLRNILIFLCQILIITACALILSKPVIPAEALDPKAEKVIVIDASVTMRTGKMENDTRFHRAVAEAKNTITETFSEGNTPVTVLLAGSRAEVLSDESGQIFYRVTAEKQKELFKALDALVEVEGTACSYGVADVEGAITLAQPVITENSDAQVVFYTATEYRRKGKVHVVDVSQPGEWNAAILNATADLQDNYYFFTVDVACYGKDERLEVVCEISGARGSSNTIEGGFVRLTKQVECIRGETSIVVFDTAAVEEGESPFIFQYDSVQFSIEPKDDFQEDNTFFLYGGTKEELNIVYYSSLDNTFFYSTLLTLQNFMRRRYDINFEIVRKGTPPDTGYDFYIYEHTMPAIMPTDGVVLLVDPDRAPEGSELTLGRTLYSQNGLVYLTAGAQHKIMDRIHPEYIGVSSIVPVLAQDGYEELMYCENYPALLVKNQMNIKIAALMVNVNRSDLTITEQFPLLMMHLFNYFFPRTLQSVNDQTIASSNYVLAVDEVVELNTRGASLVVAGAKIRETYTVFPSTMTLSVPGTYTLTHASLSGQDLSERIFVKIASELSNINRTEDILVNPVFFTQTKKEDEDLLVYFAAALVALLFVEWWLQSKEQG